MILLIIPKSNIYNVGALMVNLENKFMLVACLCTTVGCVCGMSRPEYIDDENEWTQKAVKRVKEKIFSDIKNNAPNAVKSLKWALSAGVLNATDIRKHISDKKELSREFIDKFRMDIFNEVRCNDPNVVENLEIALNIDVFDRFNINDLFDDSRKTFLDYAVNNKNVELCSLLLSCVSYYEDIAKFSRIACIKDNVDLLRLFIEKDNGRCLDLNELLDFAAQNNSNDVRDYLFKVLDKRNCVEENFYDVNNGKSAEQMNLPTIKTEVERYKE